MYLVEQHRAVRQALADWLGQAPDVQLVGYSGDLDTAQREIESQQPQVVLLEIKRADGKGMQLLSKLARMPQRPRLVVLTSYATDLERDEVLRSGADAYVLKDIDTDELVRLVHSTS